MARTKKGQKIDGWINLYKPVGITSTQAVGKIRYALKAQKVGHGGTLDPLACGILPIALGEATKTIPFIQDSLKVYHFTVTWGEQRTTDDAEGEVLYTSSMRPSQEGIQSLLPRFVGEIEQTPPQFSAVKIDGERAYDIARDGDVADIKPRMVYIEDLTVIAHKGETTDFSCTCGVGTYIRSLARDMGQIMGCYGYISTLERVKVGCMDKKDAISLDFFIEMIDNPDQEKDLNQVLLPLQTVLDDIPVLALKDQEVTAIKNGNAISFLTKPDLLRLEQSGINWKSDELTVALITYNAKPMALAEVCGAKIQPVRVFHLV